MQIYDGIFNIVEENLSSANQKFEYMKTTFLCDVMSPPQIVDVQKFLDLSNPQFFQAVYVAAYKRLPEKRIEDIWRNKWKLSSKEFQKEFLKSISNSSVIAINHIQLINNPYFEQRRGMRYKLLGTLYGLTDKSFLREFGKKLPQPVQKIIRKVFL